MRRTLLLIAVAGLIAGPTLAIEPIGSHGARGAEPAGRAIPNAEFQDGLNWLVAEYTQKTLEEGLTYVGDEYCIACHSWAGNTRSAKHRKALRSPLGANSLIAGKGVVADYDQNGVDDFMQGLDFNTIESVFDQYKPNAPVLSYDAATDTYWISIGETKTWVVITQGGTGDWKQRYLVRVPVTGTASGFTRDNYVSPVQYNEKTFGYVGYHPEHWYDENNMPRFGVQPPVTEVADVGRSYSQRCIGCHTTGFRAKMGQNPTGEWIYRPYPASLVPAETREQYPDYDHDGIPDIVNIGCEACHGPGSAHVMGGGDPNEILAPSTLDTEQANEICQQCHIRTKSAPNETYGYPYNDTDGTYWIPGRTEAPLTDFYVDHAGVWPDGKTSKQHHQQHEDLYNSSKPTFEFHPIKCVECHSPHSGGKHMVVTRIVDGGLTIPTENNNNTLCLACHATHGAFEEITTEQVAEYEDNLTHIGEVVSAHTYHPYAPERSMGLSRCSKCHMPKTAKSAINYDIHGHTFEAIAPEKTLMYAEDGGMPNSCAVSCHGNKVNSFGLGLDPTWGTWNSEFNTLLAEDLAEYLGPGGAWWDTEEAKSATRRHLENALPPGHYEPEADPDFAD